MGLHLTATGRKLMRDAEKTAASAEADVAARLTPAEQRTLLALLKKVYKA
jgi:DNA-binding MarR family transcriptional regulator